MNYRKLFFRSLIVVFLAINAIAFIHAYRFTHFSQDGGERTKDPGELPVLSKVKILFTGIDNPRPTHKLTPQKTFQSIEIASTENLEGWRIQVPKSKGTVILFHGYAGEKSSLISRSDEFNKLGYSTVLIDFMGTGGSEGNSTTIGFREAEQVHDCFESIQKTGEKNIILFGTSMGAAAILKALDDHSFEPSAIILECPFGSLYKTVSARFKLMGVPDFPLAAVLTFWGGVQNGYWAFGHNPSEYAKAVKCPTLLLFGERDDRVTKEETEEIFSNLQGRKILKTYPNVGHQIFEAKNQSNWIRDVSQFIQENKKDHAV